MPHAGRITRQDRAQVDPLPSPAVPAPLDPPIAPISGDTLAWTLHVLEAFARELGVTAAWEAMAAGHDGLYDPQARRIAINSAVSVNEQAAALAHELAHALVRVDHLPEDRPSTTRPRNWWPSRSR